MKPLLAVRALGARPVAVLATAIAVFALGNALLVGCGGKTNQTTTETPSTQTSNPPAGETPATTPSAGGEPSLAMGEKVYKERCVLCHGPNGKGDGAGAAGLDPKPRDHTNGAYMNARTDEELLQVIHNGKGNMPAWGNILSETEMKSVLMYVRTLAVPPYPGAAKK